MSVNYGRIPADDDPRLDDEDDEEEADEPTCLHCGASLDPLATNTILGIWCCPNCMYGLADED